MKNPDDIKNPILVPDENGELHSFSVPDDDPELVESLPRALSHPLLKGLDLPSETRVKCMTEADKARWLDVVATLLQRGAGGATAIAELTGLSLSFARQLIADLKEAWAKSLSPAVVNVRREQIYLEAERVKQFCWEAIAQNFDAPAVQLKYLQLILSAGQRQSSLIGAERSAATVAAEEAGGNATLNPEAELIKTLNLDVNKLRAIGETVSKVLSEKEDDEK